MGGQMEAPGRHRLQALDRVKDWVWPREPSKGEAVLATVLSECLDEIQRNGGDIDAALALYPGLEEEIRPLLEVAVMLPQRE